MSLQGEAKSVYLRMKSLIVYTRMRLIWVVALKDTEATSIEFYCLDLIAVLSTLDNVVLLCPGLWH